MKKNTLRIIGGKWRGRNIHFQDSARLRPTLDYVRETLFNWLQPHIVGAKCLDLFAGTGILGLEALSRGAKDVTFIDQSKTCCQSIRNHLAMFTDKSGHVIEGALPHALTQLTPSSFDIVFLDPPYHSELVPPILETLIRHKCLHQQSLIYIEAGLNDEFSLAPTFKPFKYKKTKTLQYQLVQYETVI